MSVNISSADVVTVVDATSVTVFVAAGNLVTAAASMKWGTARTAK